MRIRFPIRPALIIDPGLNHVFDFGELRCARAGKDSFLIQPIEPKTKLRAIEPRPARRGQQNSYLFGVLRYPPFLLLYRANSRNQGALEWTSKTPV